jgi:ATP-dependent Lon protease
MHLIAGSDHATFEKQNEKLVQVYNSFAGTSTSNTSELDASPNFHARSITTDHGWKITLDQGLDLFQWFEFSPFNAAAVMQEARMVKGCEVSIILSGQWP